jgi:hypothetical protein
VQGKQCLTIASSATAARERFWMNVRRHGWAAAAEAQRNCHCRDCQWATGSAFAPMLLVPCSAVTITGDIKYYDVTGESGNIVSRGFCATCGTPLCGKGAPTPDLIGIRAGSLDDPSWYQPVVDIYAASAQPWDYLNPALQKFERSPTEEQIRELLTARG